MAPAPDTLNERQEQLLAQVSDGKVTEQLPDTLEQLLTLARLGHLEAAHDADGWHLKPSSAASWNLEAPTQDNPPGSDETPAPDASTGAGGTTEPQPSGNAANASSTATVTASNTTPADPEPLNEREQALVGQVEAGNVTEREPDTEVQLLRLAVRGHVLAEHDAGGWRFLPRHGASDGATPAGAGA